MRDTLFLGDRSYSSWSLRAWLILDRFGLPADLAHAAFDAGSVIEQLPQIAPARTVPALRFCDGTLVWDSLAIAEELATRHPEAALWPTSPAQRGAARSLAAEMHASFAALRSGCPMNLRAAYRDSAPPDAVLADLDRIETLWAHARSLSGARPWLFGSYTVADAFFAPVAARIAGYSLPVGADAASYVAAHLADPSFRRWRAMGLARGATLPRYARDYPEKPWPGPAPLEARAVEGTDSVNIACPYSGAPVTHVAEIEGTRYGFCSAFCRDKTVADPAAWPAFMDIRQT